MVSYPIVKNWVTNKIIFLIFVCNTATYIFSWCINLLRNPDPKSRPQFGQITKLLAGNVLDWSDDDKLTSGEDGMKLGAPLESTANLYSDLQYSYM